MTEKTVHSDPFLPAGNLNQKKDPEYAFMSLLYLIPRKKSTRFRSFSGATAFIF
jgi:hypothetical protein